MIALPYAIITIRAGAENFDLSLTKAASVLGARPLRVFARVVMPLIMPAVIAGGLFAFLISFDEAVVAQFISGPSGAPLAKRMWDAMQYQSDPVLSAISTMQIGLTTAILIGVALVRRRMLRVSTITDRDEHRAIL
jgi:putative spermidine/putrescine transport system permease protein